MRHEPVVTGLSQENLSYWIWKSLEQSGRPGCLIFMLILGLLSSGPARAWHHGTSGTKRRTFACNAHLAGLDILAKRAICTDNRHSKTMSPSENKGEKKS